MLIKRKEDTWKLLPLKCHASFDASINACAQFTTWEKSLETSLLKTSLLLNSIERE